MARVLISTQGWGVLQDTAGNGVGGYSVTLKNRDGSNATHYSARTGGTSSTASITSSVHGTLDRWVDPGEYTLTVGSDEYDVDAASGADSSSVSVIREAPLNVEYPEYAALVSGSDWTPAVQAAVDALPKVASGDEGGGVYLGNGVKQLSSGVLLHNDAGDAKDGVRVFGDGKRTVIKPVMSSGDAFYGTSAGYFRLENFVLDMAGCSGSANGIRLLDAPLCRLDVEVNNLNTTGWPVRLEGCMLCDLTVYLLTGNKRGVALFPSATYPSNANRLFLRAQDSLTSAGPALHIKNGEANTLVDGSSIQNWKTATDAVLIEGAAGDGSTWQQCRSNKIHGYFEMNGNTTAGTNNVKVNGVSSGVPVLGTIIRAHCNASAHDNPTNDIHLVNADGTVIDDLYSNLASPHVAVKKGAGVKNTHYGMGSTVAGTVEVSGVPTFRATKTPAQTITAGNPGAWTKVTFEAETFDTNSDFDLSNERFLPTVKGIYEIEAAIDWESVQDAIQYGAAIYKNGSAYEDWSLVGPAVVTATQPVRTRVAMNGTTDYVEVFVRIVGSGANNKNVGVRSTFSGSLVVTT